MSSLYLPAVLIIIVGIILLSTKIAPPIAGNLSFMSKDYTMTIKGLAMILIMLGHCTCQFQGGRLMTPCGGIGVSIFLVASGYGLNESFKKNGLANFWKKRIIKVWLPYSFITIVAAIFCLPTLKEFVFQMLCVNCLYWFVPYIIICYLVFWGVSLFIPKYRLLIFLISGISTLFLLPDLQAEQAMSFFTGVWLSENINFIQKVDRKRMQSFTLFFIAVGALFLALKQTSIIRNLDVDFVYNMCQMLIKWPLAIAVVFGLMFCQKVIGNPFIYFTGVISYELYLVHFRFYTLVGNNILNALVLLVSSYIVSWLFSKVNNMICKSKILS